MSAWTPAIRRGGDNRQVEAIHRPQPRIPRRRARAQRLPGPHPRLHRHRWQAAPGIRLRAHRRRHARHFRPSFLSIHPRGGHPHPAAAQHLPGRSLQVLG